MLKTFERNKQQSLFCKRKPLLVAMLACIFSFLCLPAAAQDHYEVQKIKFKGNKTFGKSTLLDNMAFNESSFSKRKFQKKEPSLYSTELMEVDIERLTRFYQSEGFLNVEVRLDSLHLNEKKKRLNIYIRIKENDPVRVDSIHITITDSLEEIKSQKRFDKDLYRSLDLKNGKRFEDGVLYKDLNKMNTAFSNHGYIYSTTDFRLHLNTDENLTSVDYTITPNKICQFGETSVAGNRYVKEKYIRRQLNYKPGETYSQELVDKTRKQLYSLQLFRIISIAPEMDKKTQLNPINLHYQIQEMPRWMTKFGVGWGTEDRFRTFADITYRGLFGGTSRLNLYAKHSYLEPYHISLSWIEPQFFLKKLSLTVNPYYRREREVAYDVRRVGIKVPVGYTFNDYIKTSVTYYYERVRQFDAVEEDPNAGYLDPTSREYLYNKSGLLGAVTFSNASPLISPVRGGTLTIGGKMNGYFFGSDFNYTKFWVDARKYQRLGNFTVAARAMVGGIHSSDEAQFVPVEDRFYSGGNNSNRGWARYMLGPTSTTTVDGATTTNPDGGKSIVEMNLEIRHPLVWQIELAAFLDVANVWTQSFHYQFDKLWYGVGGGIRINTPIGPVRFDVGVPIVGTSSKKVEFFLSIGQAF